MFDCPEYHSHFAVMEMNRHELLTDKCGIHFFELKKIGKKADKENRKELWLQLINAETKEEFDMFLSFPFFCTRNPARQLSSVGDLVYARACASMYTLAHTLQVF